MKKICVILLSALLLLCGCEKKQRFKEYSNVPSGEFKTIEMMNVPVDMTKIQGFKDTEHVFRRTTMKESFRLVDEQATGILYFGYTTCPYCIQVVPVLNDIAKQYNQTVYYIDVYNEQDKISDADINKYLEVYREFLTEEEGEPVFFVPQVFVIVNGVIVDGHTGAVDSFDPSTQSSLNLEQKEELTLILESMIRVLEK